MFYQVAILISGMENSELVSYQYHLLEYLSVFDVQCLVHHLLQKWSKMEIDTKLIFINQFRKWFVFSYLIIFRIIKISG